MACIGTGGILNTFGKYLMKFFNLIFHHKLGIIISTLLSIILYIYFVYYSRKEEEKENKLNFYWIIPFIIIAIQIFNFVKNYSNIFNLIIQNIRNNNFGLLITFFIIFSIFNLITSYFAQKYFDIKIATIIISCFTFISLLFMTNSDNYLQYSILIIMTVIALILGTKLYKSDEDNKLNRTLAIQFILYLGGSFYLFLKMIDKILYFFFYILADIVGIFSSTDKLKLIQSLKQGFLHKLLVVVLIIGVVFIGANMSQFTYMLANNKKENLKYFEENRCNIENILLYPFVKPTEFSNISFQNNFNYCTTRITKSVVETFLSPVYDLFDTISDIFGTVFQNIEDLRKISSRTRNNFADISHELYYKLRNQYSRFAFLANAFNKLFTKIYQTFDNMFHVVLYIFYTFGSIYNGPLKDITKVTSFFCFDPDTLIMTNNGSIKIKNIKINQQLLTGKVLSVMKFTSNNAIMYNYNGTIVAGSHLINENNRWIRVEDSLIGKKINYNKKYLYCLSTTDNRIISNNNEFRDYFETNDYKINKQIQQIISNKLNNKIIKVNNDKSIWGFMPLTKINNKFICDYTIDHINILGVIKFKACKNNIYEFNNIICTGNTFVKYNNEWIQISKIGNKKYFDNDQIFYNIVTNNNIIEINNNLFCDFEQVSDNNTNNTIDNLVCNYLNFQ